MSNITDFTEHWVKRQEQTDRIHPVPEYDTDARFMIMQPYQVVAMIREMAWDRFYDGHLGDIEVEQLTAILASVLDKIHFHQELKASVTVRQDGDKNYNVLVYALDMVRSADAHENKTKTKPNFVLEAKFLTLDEPKESWTELVVMLDKVVLDIPDEYITTRQALQMLANMNALVKANSGAGALNSDGVYTVVIPQGGKRIIAVTLGLEHPITLDLT